MKLLIAAVAALLAGPVLAQTPPAGAPPGPAGAQGLTLQQLQDQQWARLSMLDSDKDGRISRAEWDAVAAMAPGQLTAAAWDRLDANKDGFVTREEFNSRVAASFALMDANHDNRVTQDEMQAYQSEQLKRMQAGSPSPAQPGPPAAAPPK